MVTVYTASFTITVTLRTVSTLTSWARSVTHVPVIANHTTDTYACTLIAFSIQTIITAMTGAVVSIVTIIAAKAYASILIAAYTVCTTRKAAGISMVTVYTTV